MNVFEFRPVGQGLFYTGSLLNNKYNFVYDCGSVTKGDYLDKAIGKYLFQLSLTGSNINFINISHLHKDHFNGLKKLCEDKNVKVERIYLPYLGNHQNVLQISLAAQIFEDSQDIQQDTDLFYFATSLYNRNLNDDYQSEFLPETEIEYIGNDDDGIKGGDRVYTRKSLIYGSKDNPYWHFEFFNNRLSKDKLLKLEAKIKEKIDAYNKKHNKNFKTVIDFVRAGEIEYLQKIYISVFGEGNNQNLTSTVLVHYPEQHLLNISLYNADSVSYTFPCIKEHCRGESIDVTILTGDAKLDSYTNKAISSILRDNSKCILQIPHHGSYPNWLAITDSVTSKCEKFVIPFGLGRSKHPDARTVYDLHMMPKAEIIEANQIHSFIYHLL